MVMKNLLLKNQVHVQWMSMFATMQLQIIFE